MIKIEHVETYGWEAAIRGMRNPMNSWDKSDSHMCMVDYGMDCPMAENCHEPAIECNNGEFGYCIGENDFKLMQTLSKAGSDHGKFLRMITVTLDITAPLYWWKEFDTYKIGTVANSCSTMHKIHSAPITREDFSFDGKAPVENDKDCFYIDEFGASMTFEDIAVTMCEDLRAMYIKTGDKKYWRYLIQLLPSSYNQKRTVQLNYQVLKSMYHARKAHKLDEWKEYCSWIETLPYAKELIIGEE